MRVEDEIRAKLEAAFSPSALSVQDESEQHRGHAGYQEGGQSHFRVAITAEVFADMNRIARRVARAGFAGNHHRPGWGKSNVAVQYQHAALTQESGEYRA